MLIFSIIVITSYVFIHAIEMSSFATRVAGRISNRVALGTTLAQTIYTLSRLLLIIFLPALAYLVESGIALNNYLIMIIITYILTFTVSIVMIIKINSLQKFYQIVFEKYTNNTIPLAILKSLVNSTRRNTASLKSCKEFSVEAIDSYKQALKKGDFFDKVILKKTLVSFLAYIFLITGFFNAFMLAIIFPENRLTLSQLTSFFHGFGAVIFAIYLDPMLSRSIDSYSDDTSWLQNVYSIFIGRALSYFVIIILLSVLLFAI
jgi:hypothetical protein